jgi:hypothetical protein
MHISKEGCNLTEDNLGKLEDLFKSDRKRQLAMSRDPQMGVIGTGRAN